MGPVITGSFEKRAPGLKAGGESDIFWSEIGSGFEEPGGTPPADFLPVALG